MATDFVIEDGATRAADGRAGERLYDVLKENGVRLDAPCGGRCFCGKCRVRIADAPEPTKAERNLLAQEETGPRRAAGLCGADPRGYAGRDAGRRGRRGYNPGGRVFRRL